MTFFCLSSPIPKELDDQEISGEIAIGEVRMSSLNSSVLSVSPINDCAA